jgi:Putative zinc binding domain
MHVETRDKLDPRTADSALPACRFCSAPLRHTFVDLGMSPLCESYVPRERLDAPEPFYPLHARICERCLLV